MSDLKSNETDQTPIAANAVNGCHPAEMGGANIAPMPAEQLHTGNGGRGHDVTLASTKRDNGHHKDCDHCGQSFTTKRPKQARYCSGNCRRKAWLERNPDKAAELAKSDKKRLQAHIIAKGRKWEAR